MAPVEEVQAPKGAVSAKKSEAIPAAVATQDILSGWLTWQPFYLKKRCCLSAR
jgi:hypothetical protein